MEQAGLKQAELDVHPVRSNMKQLLRSLDQLCPFEPDGDLARPDYVRSFLDYVNTLASVLVCSLGSEGKSFVSPVRGSHARLTGLGTLSHSLPVSLRPEQRGQAREPSAGVASNPISASVPPDI